MYPERCVQEPAERLRHRRPGPAERPALLADEPGRGAGMRDRRRGARRVAARRRFRPRQSARPGDRAARARRIQRRVALVLPRAVGGGPPRATAGERRRRLRCRAGRSWPTARRNAAPRRGAVVNRVNVIGVPPEFSDVAAIEPAQPAAGLAGSSSTPRSPRTSGFPRATAILLTLGRESHAPADSIFAYRSRAKTTRDAQARRRADHSARGIGAFSLRQDPSSPRNLYVSLDWLQAQLGQPGQANTILIGRSPDLSRSAMPATGEGARGRAGRFRAAGGLRPSPHAESGARILRIAERRGHAPARRRGPRRRVAAELGMSFSSASVYLANTLSVVSPAGGRLRGRSETPYSVVAGVVSPAETPAGPLPVAGGRCDSGRGRHPSERVGGGGPRRARRRPD